MHHSLNHSIYSIVQQCSELKHTDAITVILFISISNRVCHIQMCCTEVDKKSSSALAFVQCKL